MHNTGGSGALELRTDARMWEVQWQELTILRLIGRGSFGFVYLAEWNYTQVAVKVLVSKGESVLGMWPMCAAAQCLYCCRMHAYQSQHAVECCSVPADDVACGEMELPERVMRELQAEAGVMGGMRNPK